MVPHQTLGIVLEIEKAGNIVFTDYFLHNYARDSYFFPYPRLQ